MAQLVVGKVKAALDQGYKVVVVLSAKSGKTNKLLDLSTRWAAEPDLLDLEWLYRLIKEPRRIGRMMKLPLFVLEAAGERLRGK